jgi:hypothetical protein
LSPSKEESSNTFWQTEARAKFLGVLPKTLKLFYRLRFKGFIILAQPSFLQVSTAYCKRRSSFDNFLLEEQTL